MFSRLAALTRVSMNACAQVLPDDGGWGFRRPGEGGTVVDVPELLAARNGQEVLHRRRYRLLLHLPCQAVTSIITGHNFVLSSFLLGNAS